MTIDMIYCVNDRLSQITPYDATFTPLEEEYVHAFNVTLVFIAFDKLTSTNPVLTIQKSEN